MKRFGAMLVAGAMAASIATGASAQQIGSDGEAFLTAIREQDGAKVTEIAQRQGGGVVDYRGYDGSTPLTTAMARKSSAYVSFLLSNGASPDIPDRKGDTPLLIAARGGFVDGVDRMLAARARVDLANRQGETPLIVAVQARQPSVVRKLLEAGANADKSDFAAGFSARDYAKRDTRNRDLLRLIETVKPVRRAVAGPIR